MGVVAYREVCYKLFMATQLSATQSCQYWEANIGNFRPPTGHPKSMYIKLKSCLSVCLSDGHAAYSPDLARIDIVCADNEALIIRLL